MKSWPSLAPFGKTLSMPGGELFYYDNNAAGKPAVALIHGLGDEADTWRHLFPLLADAGFRVIAPDLPGFGRSVWQGKIGLGSQCGAVIRLLDETGAASAENPAVLAGSSLGAGIAEIAAYTRPDLAKAIVLIDGCFPMAGKADKGFALASLPFIGKSWYRSFRKNHDAARKSLYPYYGDLDAMSSEDRDFLFERVVARVESDSQERGYLSTLRSIVSASVFGRQPMARKIKTIPGKILILWGDGDCIMPPEKADFFRSLRPDAEFVFIPGAGHLPHQEKPAETAAEMLRFMQEVK